jgi:hypothetical protein
MLRKFLAHSNIICVTLTFLVWVVTIVYRFAIANQQVPPDDWVLWVITNNLMVAGFSYQLGVIAFRREGKKRRWFKRGAKVQD